jgi:hypothetical protein
LYALGSQSAGQYENADPSDYDTFRARTNALALASGAAGAAAAGLLGAALLEVRW